MILPLGPQTDRGSVIEPQPAALGLLLRHLESLLPPYTLDPLVVHPPALVPQQRGDPAIAIAAVLCGQPDDPADQPLFVIGDLALMPLRRPRLPDRPTRPPL